MSFILDALKKSENERQGQRGLGVADVPVVREAPRAPVWMWWLLGLLGVNLLVLMAVLLRPTQEPSAAAADAAREAAAVPADLRGAAPAERRAATVPERVAPELAAVVDRARTERARSTPTAVTAGSSDGQAQQSATATPERVSPSADQTDDAPASSADPSYASLEPQRSAASAGPGAPAETASPGRSGAADITQPPARGGEALSLPTLDELRVRGDTGLPDLHLDIHVWSEQPRGRFVYVNTMKYREGDALAEGPRVDTIVPEGVVLEQNGRRFLLPRE